LCRAPSCCYFRKACFMSNQTAESTQEGPRYWGFIVAALCVVTVIALVSIIIYATQAIGLGDAYEGLSALFSVLAFIGVIYALIYQRAELKL
jgi:hypothetical protein